MNIKRATKIINEAAIRGEHIGIMHPKIVTDKVGLDGWFTVRELKALWTKLKYVQKHGK